MPNQYPNNIALAIQNTKSWLTQSVIKHNFCPYAKQPYDNDLVGYSVYTGNEDMVLLEQIALCCIELDQKPVSELETSLIIVADKQYLADFYIYLDMLDMANTMLMTPNKFVRRFSDEFLHNIQNKKITLPNSWQESYQIASFHPQYFFEGSQVNDRENYTNRSPYPIFHLLRNDSIDAVRMDDAKAEHIVSRNCEHLRHLEQTEFEKLIELTKL